MPSVAATSESQGHPPASSVWTVPLRTGLAPDAPPAFRTGALAVAAPSEHAHVRTEPVPAVASLLDEEREIRFFRDRLPEDSDDAGPATVGAADAGRGQAEQADEAQAAVAIDAQPVEEDAPAGDCAVEEVVGDDLTDEAGLDGGERHEAERHETELDRAGFERDWAKVGEADLSAAPARVQAEDEVVRDLKSAFENILAGVVGVTPKNGPIPALMVAATEPAEGTTDVALAVGEVAAAAGLRVLVVEASRARPTLAAHAEPDDRPALVGMRDGLRIVLRADGIEGLFLAPLFKKRAHLAAALAHNAGAPVIEDIADTFDLLIIDGGEAATATAIGWSADCYLCVGGDASIGEGEHFLQALGNPQGSFAGTVAEATFVPPPPPRQVLRVISGARSAAARFQPVLSDVAA